MSNICSNFPNDLMCVHYFKMYFIFGASDLFMFKNSQFRRTYSLFGSLDPTSCNYLKIVKHFKWL